MTPTSQSSSEPESMPASLERPVESSPNTLVVALIALAGSVATIGWLLVKGVDEQRWRALAITEAGR